MEHVPLRDAGRYGTRHALVATVAITATLLAAPLFGTGDADGSLSAPDPAVAPSSQGFSAAEGVGAARLAEFEDSTRERLYALPPRAVEQLYVECSREAIARSLGSGEAELCSVVYDVLLTRHFGGDFDALIAWSRQQHAAGADDAGAPTLPQAVTSVAAGGPAATRVGP